MSKLLYFEPDGSLVNYRDDIRSYTKDVGDLHKEKCSMDGVFVSFDGIPSKEACVAAITMLKWMALASGGEGFELEVRFESDNPNSKP